MDTLLGNQMLDPMELAQQRFAMPPMDVAEFCPACGLVSYPLVGEATRYFADSDRWLGDIWHGGQGKNETWWKREPHVCWRGR
jgi:hypothetical protein